MRRLDISNTHPQVLEAWEYGTVAGSSRCQVYGHPDGYALLTLDDLCALRFLQDLQRQAMEPDTPFPLVSGFLPSGITYANGDQEDVFICTEPVTELGWAERKAVMGTARRTFAKVVTPPDEAASRVLLDGFECGIRNQLPDSAQFEQDLARLVQACSRSLQWWRANMEHVPREGFVFGTALTQCAWRTPRGAVLLPHLFCSD